MNSNVRIRYGVKVILDLGVSETKNDFAGVHKNEIIKRHKFSKSEMEPIIAALGSAGLIMNVGREKNIYMLSRPLEYISILDIHKAFEIKK